MTSQMAEPTPDTFAGKSTGALIKRYLLATRPKFFTASVLPVLVGFAWAYKVVGEIDGMIVSLALLATVLVHAASNVYNDVSDDINGTDVNNVGHIHPYTGGSRFIQNGILTRAQMARFSKLLFALAMVAGGALIWLKGLTVLWLGLAGIGLGVFYSMPRVQLIAHGLGEISIVLAFGVLPVAGSAWLIMGTFDTTGVWISVVVGLWVAAILQINEVPDIVADAAAGKRTLAVRLGERGVAYVYFAMHAAAFAILAGLVVAGNLPMGILIAPVLLVLMALRAAATITPPPYENIVRGIEMTLAIQLLGCVWLAGYFFFLA